MVFDNFFEKYSALALLTLISVTLQISKNFLGMFSSLCTTLYSDVSGTQKSEFKVQEVNPSNDGLNPRGYD